MPHDFTKEINAAFAGFEESREKLVALPPICFVNGPYHAPPVEIGDEVECARYGLVKVVGWSAGPLPWPQCHINGPRSLILFEDLARAVIVESRLAIALAWGVSGHSVSKWRSSLDVERANKGAVARWKSNIKSVISPTQNQVGLELAHARATRIKAETTKRKGPGLRQEWAPEVVALMGALSDAEIGQRLGCDPQTVGRERRRRAIPSIGHSGNLPNLQNLDGARVRAQRYALDLTQADVAARLSCNVHRVSHLESGHAPRVKVATITALARALECQPDDLRPLDLDAATSPESL